VYTEILTDNPASGQMSALGTLRKVSFQAVSRPERAFIHVCVLRLSKPQLVGMSVA